MAEVNTDKGKNDGKKGKQKKMTVRVDFTPMVDMNMLLITFFMLCTSLSKPQTMEISMPSKDQVTEAEQTKVKASKAITLLLGEDDKIYYYFGEPDYEHAESLQQTDYSPAGLRDILLERPPDEGAKTEETQQGDFRRRFQEAGHRDKRFQRGPRRLDQSYRRRLLSEPGRRSGRNADMQYW